MTSYMSNLPAPRFAPARPSPLSQPTSLSSDPHPRPRALQSPLPSAGGSGSRKRKHGHGKGAGGGGGGGAGVRFESSAGGVGKQFGTQIVKLVDALKQNNAPMNLSDLEAVTGVHGLQSEHTDVPFNQALFDAFNAHDRVLMTGKGLVKLWSYRPDFMISNAKQVLDLLKRYQARGGMPINTLKQSWPGVQTAIDELESQGKVLVLKYETGKGTTISKTVFYDPVGDREEMGPKRGALDDEFRDLWHTLQTPTPDVLTAELLAAGLTSNNTSTLPTVTQGSRRQKKRGNRKVKLTNTHLDDVVDLSRDYVPPGQEKEKGKGKGKGK